MNKPQLLEIINRHDPIGIIFKEDGNWDEYAPEVDDIRGRLPSCKAQEDVQELLWRVFTAWFGKDIAETKEPFHAIAEDIWLNLRE